ncbi:MAG: DUF1465 family protein [Pseudomonadota bacterium]
MQKIEKTELVDESGTSQFVRSELFARTFREGMSLVENTANYLDGEGRDASKELSRHGALAYAGASMRLTTQLMQIASWLLVLRAVREGDIDANEALEPKYRLPQKERGRPDKLEGELPNELTTLIDTTEQLYDRIGRLDADLFGAQDEQKDRGDAASQQRALFDAFDRG